MIQRHIILINSGFSANTGTTAVVDSLNLTTFGGYEANNVQGLGGGITNSSNVRGFLNNDNNDIIINSFFSYLTGTTTTSQFSEIYHSDQKLSEIFNDYYISSVVNNRPPSTSVLDSTLTGTTEISVLNDTTYAYNGVAPEKGMSALTSSIVDSTKIISPYSALTTFTTEQSYYIPILIKRNHKQISRLNFDICDNIVNLLLTPPVAPILDSNTSVPETVVKDGVIGGSGSSEAGSTEETTIHTTLQCFVDINLETDENSVYSIDLLEVSFSQPVYNFEEGSFVEVDISLSAPSIGGYEEVEVDLIINNTSLSDISVLSETYPQSISFSAGQQSQTIRFFANTDLFEEGSESFDVIITPIANTVPGQYITTTVNIIDTTDLKEVFFDSRGFNSELSNLNNKLTFSTVEGASKNIRVSLDSPSTLGVESVTVQLTDLTANASDYIANLTYDLSWSAGEQHKDILIESILDEEIEDNEDIQLSLVSPINVNVINPSEAILSIIDDSPEPLYATINLQASYVQWGGVNAPTAELRWIRENVGHGSVEPGSNQKKFLKFGHPVSAPFSMFNPPLTNNSSAPILGSNSIGGYDSSVHFNGNQNDAIIFFGEKPDITFGYGTWSVNQNVEKTYGDLRLRIKSLGTYPVKINGTTLVTNDFIVVPIDKLDYSITLPANNNLIVGGDFYNGSLINEDTLVDCLYDFTFEVDFEELNFQLRGGDNSVSPNKEINIGTHLFTETYTLEDSVLPQNNHNLITRLNNVWPYWESDGQSPGPGSYCLPAGSQSNPSPLYPIDISDLQRVVVDGMLFLHQDDSTENDSSTTKTTYERFYFSPSGQTASSSGCTGRLIEYEWFNSPPYTNSIPFYVLQP